MEGAGGGAGGDRLGGVGEEGLGSNPLPQPHPPNRAPSPTHNTWSTLGKSQLDESLATSKGLLGGGGVQVRGVGLVVAVPGVGGPQVKKSRLQPILGVRGGGGGNPWWRLVATITGMSPLCS